MNIFKRKQPRDQQSQERKLVSVIDIEPLLAEISTEVPSDGNDQQIDSALVVLERKVESVSTSDEDDESGRIGEWREIQKTALDLSTRTHDLRVAMLLTRALLHTEGIIGLHDGLKLLEGLIDRCWDTLHPQPDSEDKNDPFFKRVNILEELCDWQLMIKPLMNATMCSTRVLGCINLRDIRIATGKKIDVFVLTAKEKESPANFKAIEAAFKECELQDLQATRGTINATLQILIRMEAELKKKIGVSKAPDFKELSDVIVEMDAFLFQQLTARGSAGLSALKPKIDINDTAGAGAGQPVESGTGQRDKPMEGINNRRDVIRMLDQICTYYQQNEPGSPVPLMLKRARQLVEKNFLEIVQDLAPKSAAEIKTLISGAVDEKSQPAE
jgi:type VI secretion system protein ImpA